MAGSIFDLVDQSSGRPTISETPPTSVSQPSAPAVAPPASQKGDSIFDMVPSSQSGTGQQQPVGIPADSVGQATDGPLTMADRAALSLGNAKGRTEYLQKHFPGNVAQDSNGEMIVSDGKKWFRSDDKHDAWDLTKALAATAIKNNPLWFAPRALAHAVAPSFVDAPSLSEIPKNLHDVGSSAAALTGDAMTVGGMMGGAAIGGAAGGAATAGPGAVPGAVAGSATGGAAGEAVRTSLGRLVGTYDASPTDQLKDVGWEGLLGAGGEVVGLGVKPVAGMLKSSLGTISNYASAVSKSTLSNIFGHLTGAGEWAVRRAIDDPDAVTGALSSATKKFTLDSGPEVINSELKSQQNGIITSMAAQAKDALQARYATGVSTLLKQTPDSFNADAGNIMREVQQELVNSGFGKMVERGAGKGSPSVIAMGAELPSTAAGMGKLEFQPLTPKDIAQKFQVSEDQLPKLLGEKSLGALQNIADLTNQWAGLKDVGGAKGAKMLMDFRKALGESFQDFYSPETPASIQRMVTQVKGQIETKIGQRFADAGIFEPYKAINDQYSKSVDAVRMFTDSVHNDSVDSLVKKLVKDGKTGAMRSLRDEAANMAGLLGDSGKERMQKVFDLEAAKGFSDFVSKGSAGNSLGQATRLAGSFLGQTNPRSVLQQVAYGSKFVDFLKKLPKPQIKELLSNDQAMQALTDSSMQGLMGEDAARQKLMGAVGKQAQAISAAYQPQQQGPQNGSH